MTTRTIENTIYIIEQFKLNNGIWLPLKRWNKKTGKREL